MRNPIILPVIHAWDAPLVQVFQCNRNAKMSIIKFKFSRDRFFLSHFEKFAVTVSDWYGYFREKLFKET